MRRAEATPLEPPDLEPDPREAEADPRELEPREADAELRELDPLDRALDRTRALPAEDELLVAEPRIEEVLPDEDDARDELERGGALRDGGLTRLRIAPLPDRTGGAEDLTPLDERAGGEELRGTALEPARDRMPLDERDSVVVRGGPLRMICVDRDRMFPVVPDPADDLGTDDRMPLDERDSVVLRGDPLRMICVDCDRTFPVVPDPTDDLGTDDRIPLDLLVVDPVLRSLAEPRLSRGGISMIQLRLPDERVVPDPLIAGLPPSDARMPVLARDDSWRGWTAFSRARAMPRLVSTDDRMPLERPLAAWPLWPLRTAPEMPLFRRASKRPVSVAPARTCADRSRTSLDRAIPFVARASVAPLLVCTAVRMRSGDVARPSPKRRG